MYKNEAEFFMSIKVVFIALLAFTGPFAVGQNPIVPAKGVNDPHIHIFNNKAYLYASHDKSAGNKKFVMEDWWVWSSADLVNWKLESVLKPEETYLKKPFDGCWATDVGYRNGKYYWYFSEKNQQAGVVVGPSPVGPWTDPLGKPLLTSDMTPTDEYDMAIFEDGGHHYIIFGVWEYYIARLADDMISLAEKPRKIVINNPEGPYGKGKTDDKPFVHKYNGKYYLSWGCFYGMADNVYGPYDYKGTVINKESFAEGYDKPTWPNGFLQGRHGSFFTWNNQWYYTYCDMSQTGNRYFRDAFISYLHYKENGEMAPVRVDGVGVGQYDAGAPRIEAEDYFAADGISKKECGEGGFMVVTQKPVSFLSFPNVRGLRDKSAVVFRTASRQAPFVIEVRRNKASGPLISTCTIGAAKTAGGFTDHRFRLPKLADKESLVLVVKTKTASPVLLNAFSFQ